MKILWVSPWFGNYRVPLYDELNKLSGGNFHLICSKENTRDLVRQKLKDALGDNVVIMEGEKRSTFGSEESDFANSALVIKKQPGLYDAIVKVNPDVLIVEGFGSWSPAGIKYAVLHHKKLCMFYERTFHVERNAPFYRRLYRRLAGIPVDAFLVNGTLTEEYLREGLGFNNKSITKGCMCADSFGLANNVRSYNAEHGRKENEGEGLSFLYVGQMVERKGIRQLIEAWSEHVKMWKNDKLVAIGQGVLLEEMRSVVNSQDTSIRDSVSLPGAIDYNYIHKYYADCDVFILPTLEDNWSLVVPEAMACGKPVACSIYNGGHPELIKDGENGYKFDPLSKESILDALDKFHRSDLESMGHKSQEIESDYTPDKVARRIFDTCCKVNTK